MRPRILTALGFGLGLLAFSACDRNSADTTVETTENPGGGGGTTTTPLTKPGFKSYAPAKDTTRAWEDSVLTVQMTSDVVSPNLFYANGKLLTVGTTSSASGSVNLAVGPNLIKLRVVRAGDSTKYADTSVTITRLLPTPTFSVLDTISYAPVTVALSAPAGLGSIRYTTDGRDPSASDSLYTAPLTFTGTTSIKARLFAANGNGGGVASKRYAIYHQVQRPTFSTRTVDTFNVVTKVALHPASSTDTIRYTTDGGDPTSTSSLYKDSIRVDLSTKIKARSFNGMNKPSSVESTTVVLQAIAPSFSLASGVYKVSRTLELTTASKCNIYYTLDSTKPVSKWTLVTATSPIVIDTNAKVWAFAGNPGWTVSPTLSATYTFVTSTPTFSLKAGTYDTTKLLTLADSTANATVHYTLDGTTPTCASTPFTSALVLDSTTLVKVVGCREGWSPSLLDSALYVFKVATPTVSPDSGVYRNPPNISFSSRSPGVIYFFTNDSSTPSWDTATLTPKGTTLKLLPGASFQVDSSSWIRIAGARHGWLASNEILRRYVVEGDTMVVADFEKNGLSNSIGSSLHFFACGNCTQDAMEARVIKSNDLTATDYKSPLGFNSVAMAFGMGNEGATSSSDGHEGPAYAGLSISIPQSLMGQTYRLVFWAKAEQTGGPAVDSLPMAVEFVLKANNNSSGYYKDGFHRVVFKASTTWKRYVYDYSAFFGAGNAYSGTQPDSTNDSPKRPALFSFPDSAAMVGMGLSKYQGRVTHNNFSPSWTWGQNKDASFSKGDMTAFRWSIIQPMISGAETVTAHPHLPSEPNFTSTQKALLTHELTGKLYLDRIQIVRQPQ